MRLILARAIPLEAVTVDLRRETDVAEFHVGKCHIFAQARLYSSALADRYWQRYRDWQGQWVIPFIELLRRLLAESLRGVGLVSLTERSRGKEQTLHPFVSGKHGRLYVTWTST